MSAILRRLLTSSFVGVIFYFFYFYKNDQPINWSAWFTWHPLLVVLAFVSILPEIIATAEKLEHDTKIKSNKALKEDVIQTHAIWGFVCKLVALLGIVAVYVYKEEKGYPHFQTIHGQLGLTTGLILLFQVALGVLQNEGIFGFSAVTRNTIKKIHKVFSFILTLVVTGTFWYGFQTNYFLKSVLKDDPNLIWVSYLFGLCVPIAVATAVALH